MVGQTRIWQRSTLLDTKGTDMDKKNTLTVRFVKHSETKGTWRYSEVEDPITAEVHIGSLYLRKTAAAKLGNPEQLTVTVAE